MNNLVSRRQRDFVVVLEDVHDPHNAAAIFRSCDGLGVQNVHLIFDQEKPYNPRRVGKSSSSSANKWLTFTKFDSAKKCIDQLHKDGYFVVGTVLDESAADFYLANFMHDKIAIMFGNEHGGLSQSALESVDQKVYIPMQGLVESFNVSVSAAIIIYEVIRQRKASERDFSFNQIQQSQLLEDLLQR